MSTNTYSTRDIVAQSFLSIDFPAQFIATLKTPECRNVGITDFYHAFCEKNHVSIVEGTQVIFTPATILGYLFTTFLIPQQSFFDSLPEDEIIQDEWGIQIKKGSCCKLKHVARRMRNALGHNHFFVTKAMNFTFWDAKPPKHELVNAEAIYDFNFDDLMFKFFPKWHEVILELMTNNALHSDEDSVAIHSHE